MPTFASSLPATTPPHRLTCPYRHVILFSMFGKVLSSLTQLTQLRWTFRTFYLTKILSLARYVPKYGNVAALHWVSKEKSNIDSINPKTHLEAYPADLARAGRTFLPGSHSPHPCSATSLTLPWRDTTLYLHP